MTMKKVLILAATFLVAVASADTLYLKNGASLQGMFVGGNQQEIQFMGPDRATKRYSISSIEALEFGQPPAPQAQAPAQAPAGVTIPTGTVITVRLIDGIDSTKTGPGERFRGSIDDPVMMGNSVLIPRGATCSVQVMQVQENKELAVKLYDMTVNGKAHDAVSNYAQLEGQGTSKGKKAARRGALLGGTGAAIGGIAGGGKGAAIGAVSGAGLGAISGAAAKGKSLNLPPETRLIFELRAPLPLG